MKKIVIFLILSKSMSAYCLPNSDCSLSGQGAVYTADQNTGIFMKDSKASYALTAIRYPMGAGKYLYQETKKFSDGRPDQITMFPLSNSIGPYNFSAPDGSLKSTGFCTSVGHCSGSLVLPSAHFTGHMTTDFDETGIRTVTFAGDGSFVDEVLTPTAKCP